MAAVNSVGEGLTVEVSSSPVEVSAPDAPEMVVAAPRHLALRVTWEPPGNDGGADITAYRIQWKTAGDPYGTPVQVDGASRMYDITGLDNGTTYSVRVVAVNSVGDGVTYETSEIRRKQNRPRPPRGVLPPPAGEGLLVTWEEPESDGGAEVTAYRLRWGDNDVRGTLPGELTHQITQAPLGIFQVIRVSAVNLGGEGPPLLVTGSPTAPPGPPRRLWASVADGQIDVQWKEPRLKVGNLVYTKTFLFGEPELTGFRVQWKSEGESYSADRQADVSATALSYQIGSLVNDDVYTIRVAALNAVGQGPAVEISATPVETESEAPQSLGLHSDSQNKSSGSLALWAKWSHAIVNGAESTSYRVQWKAEGEEYSTKRQKILTDPEQLQHRISGVIKGTVYTVRVSAVLGDDMYGPAIETSAVPVHVPDPPTKVKVRQRDGRVTVSWSPPPDSGAPLTSYRLSRFGYIASDLTATSIEITGLYNGQVYTWGLKAANHLDMGRDATIPADMRAGKYPEKPVNVALVPGDGTLTVTWSAPFEDPGPDVDSYRVRLRPVGQSSYSRQTTLPAGSSHEFAMLDNDQIYEVEIAAINVIGTGRAITVSAAPGVAASAPAAPPVLTAVADDGQVFVSWEAPEGDPAPESYLVTWRSEGNTGEPDGEATVTEPFYQITELTNDLSYTISIASTGSEGQSKPSVILATPVALPGAPKDLVTAAQQRSLLFSWLIPDDGGEVSHYRVLWRKDTEKYDDTLCSSRRAEVSSGLHFQIGNLPSNTEYWVKVIAVNRSGDGPATEMAVSTRPQEGA